MDMEDDELPKGRKSKQLKNNIFERIFKKNKDWSYQNHMA